MGEADREKWDGRYAPAHRVMGAGPKAALVAAADALPTTGWALEVAAGEGQTAVWLAERGLSVDAVDISARGLAKARALATERGVSERVRTWEHDLDRGLPTGLRAAYDVVSCVHFWPGPGLGRALAARVAPGGVLLLVALVADGRQGGPSPRYLATEADARALVPGFAVLRCEEVAGGAHPELRLLARRTAGA